MRQLIICILFFRVTAASSQPLESWHTYYTENNPEAYLANAGKQVALSPADAAGRLYAIGRCYHYLNQEDIALKYYLMAKKKFDALGMKDNTKDMALAIHILISSQERYDKYGDTFLTEYSNYAKETGSHERQALAMNEYGKEDIMRYGETGEIRHIDSAVARFTKALGLSRKSQKRETTIKILANLAAARLEQGDSHGARVYLKQTAALFRNTTDKYIVFTNYYNYGRSYFDEENYGKAVVWFKKAEQIKIPKFRNKRLRLLYEYLSKAYDFLDDQPNRRKYQQLYTELNDAINDKEQNIAIHDINVKYQVEEKDRKISTLEQFRKKVQKNKVIFGVSLFLVFLLALYSFIRWKKVDIRNKRLAREKEAINSKKEEVEALHNQTVEELENVKRVVTQEFILVKNKKINLAELMYIQAQDHYVDFYTADGKSHTDRDTISKIAKELPPNFIKIHRSFIINKNFIESILKSSVLMKDKAVIPIARGKTL